MVNGPRNTIPTNSCTNILSDGTAIFDSGFPSLMMVDQNASGITADNKDMNRALYSVTLTTVQAAKNTIILSGTQPANINIIFPAWQKGWTVVNNCTGGYVICKTPSGTGVIVYAGSTALIYGTDTYILTKIPASF